MKKLTKTLLPAIALLMASIVSLVGVTFAWFQNGTTAEIEEITADVVGATGILVSWDAKTWKSVLSVEDAEYSAFDITATDTDGTASGYTDFSEDTTFKYAPVSTAGAVSSGALSFFSGTVKNGAITDISDATSSGSYAKFDIYFNVTEATAQVKMQDSSKVAAKNIISEKEVDSIGLASRIAFINQGAAATYELARALTAGTTSLIWEPNATTHTYEGIVQHYGRHDSASDSHTAVFPYYGLNATTASSTTLNIRPENLNGAEKDYMAAVTTVTTNSGIVFNLTQGINKISVYVWVEGQDADCLNNLAASQLALTLNFEKVVAA